MDLKGHVVFDAVDSELEWWQTTIIYQIYPRSFQDSTGNGVGDLKGILSRLDHFQCIGVETIWLSPIYKSPMKDHGYDVEDFYDVDPIFGSLQDFDDLIEAVHKRGMKLMMDYIPNHTSDLHPWFIESKKGGTENRYTDYYVWHDGKVLPDGTRCKPNNWISVFGDSAWTWDKNRQQYYFHHYLKEQPDLNWRNPVVRADMAKVLEFWLERGVDGFRVDAISTLYEVEDMSLDEPRSYVPDVSPFFYFQTRANCSPSEWFINGQLHIGYSYKREHRYFEHVYTRNQPETYEVVQEWRHLFDRFEKRTGKPHIYMVTELYDPTYKHSMKYYDCGADGPFNFNFLFSNQETDGLGIFRFVNQWLTHMPKGKWPNWVTGNHDKRRISGRKGIEYVDAYNMLLLLLPGTPTTYQGEEIGMTDTEVSFEDTQDPWGKNFGKERYKDFTRDLSRGPMHWSRDKHAGFSTAKKTWLPINPDYLERNVQSQMEHSSGVSALQIYRELSRLRRTPSFQKGKMLYCIVNQNIFSFVRHLEGYPNHLVAINFGKAASVDDYTWTVGKQQLGYGKVLLHTGGIKQNDLQQGSKVNLTNLRLNPADGVVIEIEEAR